MTIPLKLDYNFRRLIYTRDVNRTKPISFEFDAVSNFENVIDQATELLRDKGVSSFHPQHCPYFGILWPSAQVLTDKVVDQYFNPGEDIYTLELGCGLGLPSLLLQKMGRRAWVVDHHPDVEKLLKRNWALNSDGLSESVVGPIYIKADWLHLQNHVALRGQKFNLILASDILYEKQLALSAAEAIRNLATDHLQSGGEIWITDPGRSYLQDFVSTLESFGLKNTIEIIDSIFWIRFRF